MKVHRSFRSLLPMICGLLCLFSTAGFAQVQQWRPVDPANPALKNPSVEKDADAEALFWEVYMKDDWGSEPKTTLYHYIQLKVFSERGVENHSKVDLIYFNRSSIRDIAGRTIKPDGTIVDLKKESVFDREIVRLSGVKVKAKSFAMPAVTPGSIIEYRWTEQRPARMYTRLQFQREFPIQKVVYYIRPLSDTTLAMRAINFHANPTPFKQESNGFHSTNLTNVPAFQEEPHMPPEDQVRPWTLLYYSASDQTDPAKFWKEYGKRTYGETKGKMKVNDEIRAATTEAVGDATTPEQKLERILGFCRTKIKNIFDDVSSLTEQDRARLKENNSPADTLKRGYGNGRDIDMLFAAMATAAGFETRVINLPDRGDIFFDQNIPDDYFLNVFDIAVKVGDSWKFFDPSSRYVSPGMLRWQQEAQNGLITDSKDPVFIKTPLSGPDRSKQKRTAKLQLTETGDLEGEVTLEYTGHFAVEKKEDYDEESPAEREKKLQNAIASRLAGAEITEIQIENVTDPFKPLICKYKVKVPAYAERTGKRLFLQPAFFQKGIGQMFAATARKHDVYFHFPWAEEDLVTIELPAGYKLDNAEAPGPLGLGDVGKYDVKLAVTTDQQTLVYQRNFQFQGIIFPKSTYPNLKAAFDTIHREDNHTVTLKQSPVTAAVK
jgi:transglutaminase-like putative cysteine protease